eukprot:CAMPEP_0206290826 /NCGR_PEP_ID=MMETSP0106_2-20121207/2815_1 /ASSEMBLY_ACC=CAM_ASM_000206 /TAXON_ID=81532 /ORGANISM="Acanthoeca-like sp., Strain 10tr" /LENGTH=423 /DNA_ID=CAMNT_0053721389 /DNA_START=143 /DNA_END=1410 /DNA_ORIENTATION=-
MTWTSSAGIIGQGCAMYFGGVIEKKVGPRVATFVGSVALSTGVALSYFSIKEYWSGFLLTYGFLFGVGMGLAYTSPFVAAGRFFPTKTGLVNGLVVAGFGCGAFVFDQVQTAYINPEHDKPACSGDDKGYFIDDKLLDRVPTVFLLLAAIYVAMQVVGCALISNPPRFNTPVARPASTTKADDDESKPLLTRTPTTTATVPLSPRAAVQTTDFWLIWMAFGLNGLATVFFSSLWKAMGENYLPAVADSSWAIAGSVASLFNAGGRIVWGAIADVVGVKRAIVAHCALSCVLYFTLYLTRDLGYSVYFTWVCALFFCIGGNFSLFPTATAHAFGKDSFGANYGCIFTSQAVAGVIGGLLSSDLVHRASTSHASTTTAAPAVGSAAPPTCPKGHTHRDDYLPALMAVGACTAVALVVAVTFLLRG